MKDEHMFECGPVFTAGLIEGARRRPLTVTIPNPLAQLVEQAKTDPAVFGKNAEAVAQKLEHMEQQAQVAEVAFDRSALPTKAEVAQQAEPSGKRKKRPPLKKR